MAVIKEVFDFVKNIMESNAPIKAQCSMTALKSVPHSTADPCGLPNADPADVGISNRRIMSFLKEINENEELNMHSVLIIKDGRVICRAAFGPYDLNVPQYTYSGCKSVISIAIGSLIGEGKLSLDERVTDMFPELNIVSENSYKKLTVENLLTMQSASAFNEIAALCAENWSDEFFTIVKLGTIGKTFNYNSLNSYILARIVNIKSGMEADDYLRSTVFAKMGIRDFYWEKCPRGHVRGGWGLYMRSEDLGKLGMLLLSRGRWNGEQLIPADYIDAATSSHYSPPGTYGDFDYGYHIWVGRNSNSFLFNGMFGQNTFCFKDSGIIVVSTAAINEMFQQSPYYGIAEKYFSGSAQAETALDIKKKELDGYIRSLGAVEKEDIISKFLYRKAFSFFKENVFGKEFCAKDARPIGFIPLLAQAMSNFYAKGLKNINFSIDENKKIYVTFVEENEIVTVPLGLNGYEITDICYGPNKFRIASRGKLTFNEDGLPAIILYVDFIEIPSSKKFKFIFKGGSLYYRHEETPGTECIKRAIPFLAKENILYNIAEKLNLTEKLDDTDYLAYKIDRRFSPKAVFKKA